MELDSWLISTSARALAFGTPLLLAALGEIYAERSGVVNLGVEGMMLLGAISGFAVAHTSGSPWLGLMMAAGVGGVAALLHAFVTITIKANQYVSGLALTILGTGLAGLLGRGFEGIPLARPMQQLSIPGLRALPLVGEAIFQNQYLLTFLALLASLVLWFVLYYTRLGMTLRSVGESPQAVDTAGISVTAVRYGAVIFGGVMAGIAGGYFSLAYRPSWAEGITSGVGWVALAIAIFAAWDPLRAILAAFLFGAFFHLSFRLQGIFSPELLKLMPYVFTILALTITALGKGGGNRLGAPDALGLPYERGER